MGSRAKKTRIGIVGSRDWPDPQQVIEFVAGLDPQAYVVVSGHGGVVDLAAEWAAEGFGFTTDIYPADWRTYGKYAGPLRNTEIARAVEILIAFWDGKSPGTGDVVRKARRYGKVVIVGNDAAIDLTRPDEQSAWAHRQLGERVGSP